MAPHLLVTSPTGEDVVECADVGSDRELAAALSSGLRAVRLSSPAEVEATVRSAQLEIVSVRTPLAQATELVAELSRLPGTATLAIEPVPGATCEADWTAEAFVALRGVRERGGFGTLGLAGYGDDEPPIGAVAAMAAAALSVRAGVWGVCFDDHRVLDSFRVAREIELRR